MTSVKKLKSIIGKEILVGASEDEKQQETIALLKLLDLGNEERKQGKFRDAKDVFEKLDAID